MMAGEPAFWPHLTLVEARSRVERGDLTCQELVEAALTQISIADPYLNSCTTIMGEAAISEAVELDRARSSDSIDASPLLGIPVVVKDNVDVAGYPCTAGTSVLKGNLPRQDAAVVAALKRCGAVVVGKTNLDELALGGECSSTLGGQSLNPWDGESVPGGSSGGSGAAVAAGMAMAAVGTDTGGSIRNPSAWCGVVSMKPTFDVVPTTGVIPLSWTLDTVGFFGGQVADTALVFAGATGCAAPSQVLSSLADPWRGTTPLTFGYVPELMELCDEGVADVMNRAVERLHAVSSVRPMSVPGLEAGLAAVLVIMLSEGAAVWEPFLDPSNAVQLGEAVRPLLDAGLLIRATDYLQAQRTRDRLRHEVLALFDEVSFLIMPSMGLDPGPAAFSDPGEFGPGSTLMQRAAKFTSMWNLTGCPVVSVPCGFTVRGMPTAMQVVGRPGTDLQVLRAAAAAEAAFDISRSAFEPTFTKRLREQKGGGTRDSASRPG